MIKAFVSNNIRLRGANTMQRAAITAALTVDNPIYLERKKKNKPAWGIDKKLQLYILEGPDIIIPRGISLSEISGWANENIEAQWDTTIQAPIDFGSWNQKFQLQPDQVPAVKACLIQNGILVAPAGSGKTVMGMRYIFERQQPALWITHTKDLMYQSKKRAEALFSNVGEVGVIGDGIIRWGDGKLLVATVQTLSENPKWIELLNQFIGTIVIDEAHHFPSNSFIDVCGQFKASYMLGLTATPERKDQLEVYMYRGIGPKLYQIDRTGLYTAGRLIKPEIRFVYTNFSYEQASIVSKSGAIDAGGEDIDYRDLLNHLIKDDARARLIVDNVLSFKDRYQIVITESIRYCYKLRDLILSEKPFLRVAVIHGPLQRYAWRVIGTEQYAKDLLRENVILDYRYSSKLKRWEGKYEQYNSTEYKAWQISNIERKRRLQLCDEKKIDVLIATQLAREGLDLPHLSVGHMAMPKRGDKKGTQNGASVEQEIGRIMRPDKTDPNKQAVWIDYVDYHVGILKSQYHSRRSVYKRLQLKVPGKPRSEIEELEKYLNLTNF